MSQPTATAFYAAPRELQEIHFTSSLLTKGWTSVYETQG